MSLAQQSTVIESSPRSRLSLPTRIPACMAAPTGITSSGGIEQSSSTSRNKSLIICWSLGIRAEPPLRTTCSTDYRVKAMAWYTLCVRLRAVADESKTIVVISLAVAPGRWLYAVLWNRLKGGRLSRSCEGLWKFPDCVVNLGWPSSTIYIYWLVNENTTWKAVFIKAK